MKNPNLKTLKKMLPWQLTVIWIEKSNTITQLKHIIKWLTLQLKWKLKILK